MVCVCMCVCVHMCEGRGCIFLHILLSTKIHQSIIKLSTFLERLDILAGLGIFTGLFAG